MLIICVNEIIAIRNNYLFCGSQFSLCGSPWLIFFTTE